MPSKIRTDVKALSDFKNSKENISKPIEIPNTLVPVKPNRCGIVYNFKLSNCKSLISNGNISIITNKKR